MMDESKKNLPVVYKEPTTKKDSAKRKRATEQEIENRREKIVELVGEYGNITNKQIAKVLGVSEPTVERDMNAIKEQSWNWVNKLAKEGYVFECRMAFSKLAAISRNLHQRFKQHGDSMSTDELVKLTSQIARLETLKIQIIQQPTLYNLRLAVKKADKFEDLLVGD
jgi:DNA-binding CsgD family transcriptional regulator